MSVLQCGGCLNIFVCQLCGTLFTYSLIAITRNLSENRSQTPISSYKMHNSRLGVRFQHTPYVCILKSWCFASLAVSAMVTDYIRSSLWITTTNRTAKTHCAIMRASVCKHTVACGCKLLHQVAVTEHLSLRNSPITTIHDFTRRWSEILAGIGACPRASVPAVTHIRKWAAATAPFPYLSIAISAALTCNLCGDWSLERCSARSTHSSRTHVCGWLAGCAHVASNVSTCTFMHQLWFVQC